MTRLQRMHAVYARKRRQPPRSLSGPLFRMFWFNETVNVPCPSLEAFCARMAQRRGRFQCVKSVLSTKAEVLTHFNTFGSVVLETAKQ